MGSYGNNIYYNPEKFGLEIVAEIEYSSGSYEFDTRVVWKKKDVHSFWTARDSGCSCPTPFEDEDLESIDRLNQDELRREVQTESKGNRRNISPEEGQEFLEKVREAVSRK